LPEKADAIIEPKIEKQIIEAGREVDLSALDPGTTIEVSTDDSTYWITIPRTMISLPTMVFGVSLMRSGKSAVANYPNQIIVRRVIEIGSTLDISLHVETDSGTKIYPTYDPVIIGMTIH
jgi:hypothetical protein